MNTYLVSIVFLNSKGKKEERTKIVKATSCTDASRKVKDYYATFNIVSCSANLATALPGFNN